MISCCIQYANVSSVVCTSIAGGFLPFSQVHSFWLQLFPLKWYPFCATFNANVSSVVFVLASAVAFSLFSQVLVLNAASSAFVVSQKTLYQCSYFPWVISRIAFNANVCFVVCTSIASGFLAVLACTLVCCSYFHLSDILHCIQYANVSSVVCTSIASGFLAILASTLVLCSYFLKWYPALHSMQMFPPCFVQALPVAFSRLWKCTRFHCSYFHLSDILHCIQCKCFLRGLYKHCTVAFSPFSHVHSFWLQLFPLSDILHCIQCKCFPPCLYKHLPVAFSRSYCTKYTGFERQPRPNFCDITALIQCKCFLRVLYKHCQWLSRRSPSALVFIAAIST